MNVPYFKSFLSIASTVLLFLTFSNGTLSASEKSYPQVPHGKSVYAAPTLFRRASTVI